MRASKVDKTVECRCDGAKGFGSYEVRGPMLVLTSTFGTAKAVVGLQDPRRLAIRMLRNNCEKAAKSEKSPLDNTTLYTDDLPLQIPPN